MRIEYSIKGVTLDAGDLSTINRYYEAACTAEYLMDNHNITDEAKAMRLGYEIRRRMQKYGYDEAEAIVEVLNEGEDE